MSLCLPSRIGKNDSQYCHVCHKEIYESKVLAAKGHIKVEFSLAGRDHYNLEVCSLKCAAKIDWNNVRNLIIHYKEELMKQKSFVLGI